MLGVAHWPIIVGGLALFAVIVAITRYVSLGSLFVAFYLPLNVMLWYNQSEYFIHMLAVSFLYTILAFVQHRSNIVRLLNGTENKTFLSKKGKKE